MSGTALTVGSFDGVHRGHQAVLAELGIRARAAGLGSVVLSFEPHPLEVVNPPAAPRLLTLPDEKRELLSALVERVEFLSFTPALAALDAEQFTRDVLVGQYRVRELVVGYDHGFGRGRSGDADLLRRLGARDGFAVTAVEAVRDNGQAISSTLIRTAIAHGDLGSAERCRAAVQHARGGGAGRGARAHHRDPDAGLTALDPRSCCRRTASTGAGGRRVRYGGMMNQGARPTFGIAERALEIHLFDFDEDLYGEAVTVEWVRRLRDVQTFPSRDALVAQLARDARAAQDSLKP
jgi:riboflavin kinase/FMN adenylyltransferase